MDPNRFDDIARTWTTHSRRQLLAALAASALASLVPRRDASAIPPPCDPASCNESFPCGLRACSGNTCQTITFEATHQCRAAANECDVAEFCTGDSLDCPTDRKRANGTACTNDGNPCTDDICQNGQCVHLHNTAACADDGNVCTADICANGTCTHPAKQDGTACPGGSCCGGQCLDTDNDPAHCGSCDHLCLPGLLCCGGACVDTKHDRAHCGSCGKRCRGSCRNGRCARHKKKHKHKKHRR